MRWVLIGANVESASAQTVQQHVLGELGRTRMRADRRALESETGPARHAHVIDSSIGGRFHHPASRAAL